LFNWDDTLFPTTEVFDRWGVPAPKGHGDESTLPEELDSGLQAWREAVHQYLCVACSLSECCIVTGSEDTWVERCIGRFAQNLRPLFEHPGPRVVYARSRERRTTLQDDVTGMTVAAMRAEASQFCLRHPRCEIISLGSIKFDDRELARSRERQHTKTILLPREPSLSELTRRIRFSTAMLPVYVRHQGDFNLDLRTAAGPLQAIARALVPELGSLSADRSEGVDLVPVSVHDLLAQEMDAPSGELGRTPATSAIFSGSVEFALSSALALLVARAISFNVAALMDLFHAIHTLPVSIAALMVQETPMLRDEGLLFLQDLHKRWIGHLCADVACVGLSLACGVQPHLWDVRLGCRVAQLTTVGFASSWFVWLACLFEAALLPRHLSLPRRKAAGRPVAFLAAVGAASTLWCYRLFQAACHRVTRRALRAQLYCNIGVHVSAVSYVYLS